MFHLIPAIHSNYPRIGDTPEQQRLRRAIARWEKGELDDAGLRSVEDDVAREVIREQAEAGLQIVSDGQIRWYCPFSYFARELENIEINGLLRYFDTNFYFRQPVARGPLRWTGPVLVRDFLYARAQTERPVKTILTGPYTLARYTIVDTPHYENRFPRLVEDYARALAQEIAALAAEGAPFIQIDEPALLAPNADLALARAAWAPIGAARGTAKLGMSLFWGSLDRVWPQLAEWDLDFLILDLVTSPQTVDRIAHNGASCTLGLGLIDGRNTRLERESEILKILERLARRLDGDHHLTPSCGLELLPRDRARSKIALVAKIAAKFAGGNS